MKAISRLLLIVLTGNNEQFIKIYRYLNWTLNYGIILDMYELNAK